MVKVKSYIDSKKDENLLNERLKTENRILKDLLNEHLKTENQILKELLKEKLGFSEKQIKQIIEKKKELFLPKEEIFLPISIFRNKLSTLEIIVKYLKEDKELSFSEISRLLNRDERTVWHAYQRAVKKKIKINILDSKIKIPISIFSDRRYSTLESLTAHLKDSHKLKFSEIAALLELNLKTVWTVYHRYQQKKNASKQ